MDFELIYLWVGCPQLITISLKGTNLLRNEQADPKHFVSVAQWRSTEPGQEGWELKATANPRGKGRAKAQPFPPGLRDRVQSFGLCLGVGDSAVKTCISCSQTTVAMSDLNMAFRLVPPHIDKFVLNKGFPLSLQKWPLKPTLHTKRFKIHCIRTMGYFSATPWLHCCAPTVLCYVSLSASHSSYVKAT